MTKERPFLRCDNLCKSYRLGAAELHVLRSLNFSVANNEFVAILGASGSGKSTLLHIIGALDKPDSGRVIFDGEELLKFSGAKANEFRNKKVGFVFQFYHLLNELNVLENIMLPAMASSSILGWAACRGRVKKRAFELCERLGLADRLRHRPYELSGGERQRVAIGRALMNRPILLLADEPTGNLDSETGNGILDIFDELHRSGQTIVMVTHDERVAQKATRTVRLADGKIISEKSI